MNFDKVELGRLAKKNGFVRDTLEKVIRLTEVLELFFNDKILAEHFVLKGGTAINLIHFDLNRLSVDVDMDFTPNLKKDELEIIRNQASVQVIKAMETKGYMLEEGKSKFTYSLDSYVFSYQNSGGMKDNLKVELNYSLRAHIYPTKLASIHNLEGIFAQIRIGVVDKRELFGSKLVALMGRAAARDLYDAWNMIQRKTFNETEIDDLRKVVIFYSILNVESKDELFNISNIDTIDKRKITRDLRPVIFTKERVNLEEMQDDVKNYLVNLLQLTDKELSCIDKYFYEREFIPELLFDDENIVERLKTHPMILWQLNKY
ncbi:MAG: nucleotidyl transferase AbiEii/AbiGii toxin family protein [Streptococcaceae bacterium]|jgi:predicted nucleotidyltransferase component of viral defense system|nr:nucleotidyl transferase AbiEii/AbiGii toxin family protein [Streptococcaceae bacterium]